MKASTRILSEDRKFMKAAALQVSKQEKASIDLGCWGNYVLIYTLPEISASWQVHSQSAHTITPCYLLLTFSELSHFLQVPLHLHF